ncbi:patatin-like phospholipase family protein [Paracoccus sphaerophysae]|uniref:patatin-like phospholipase family protein n=1 Tax=Paracoccus sphaerophysae TaxID=690417 RepID=UPI00068FE33B|nr:patatin-like phospholipase family protein [Paracoccus sphaerophysae]
MIAAHRAGRTARSLVLVTAALATAACDLGPVRDLPAVPAAATLNAAPPGYGRIRAYGNVIGASDAQTDSLGAAALARLRGAEAVDILALSGGGDGGAFGAGLLIGWTERGDRPEFDMVTGVSTGALIAPLAFLGPRYDGELRRSYTQTQRSDVVLLKPLQVLTGAPSVGDSSPLRDRIAAIVTPAMVDEIAAERRKGRLLLIGTTNLDAQRQVIWDIGRIAASGQPDRVELIRAILLASASIPAAFPPVAIDVVADGHRFQEMHVDGGVTRGVFAYPPEVTLPPRRGPRRMWVVRNSKLGPEPETVAQNALAIAGRSVSTMIKAQSLVDISEIQHLARRDGFDFHVTAVPAAQRLPQGLPFDPAYMDTVYRVGLASGRSRNGWADSPAPLLD